MDKLLETIVSAIEDKKGKNIISLDLSVFDGAVASSYVICNADSTAQVEAITNGIEERTIDKLREKPRRIEGLNNAIWVVMDYFDVMVHIFLTEARDFYRLEQLWADAPATRHEYEL
jgi:ribosome-associated protein